MKRSMKSMIVAAAAGALLFLVIWKGSTSLMVERRAREQQAAFDRDATFERGFWAGSRATVKALSLDTNTGKWNMEITNLLSALRESQDDRAQWTRKGRE